jgi:FKBP-type peptidyl-prolyl cis-trans isomerase
MNKLKVKTDIVFPFVFVGVVVALVVFLLIKNNAKPEVLITEDLKTEVTNNIETNNMEEKISKAGDVLVMNYTGRLENGTIFDSNILPEFNHVTPFEFTLGAGQVIQGWDEGLLGMKVGEKKTLVIPPEKGYGDRAVSVIPANSTLIFEVELVGIK